MAKNSKKFNLKGKWGTFKQIAKNKLLMITNRRFDNKIIITGTGRAGTSFLMVLLTRLGFDTGFEPFNEDFSDQIRAGCEYKMFVKNKNKQKDIFSKAPKILKHPEYCFRLFDFLSNKSLGVKHVIIPVRDLKQSAQSRIKANLFWEIPGINKKADGLEGQLLAITWALGKLVATLIIYNIPHTFMHFPKLTQDKNYCFNKLKPVFPSLNKQKFNKIFISLAKPEPYVT